MDIPPAPLVECARFIGAPVGSAKPLCVGSIPTRASSLILIIFNHIVKPHSGHRTDLTASRFKFAAVFEDVAIFERPHFYDCSRLHES